MKVPELARLQMAFHNHLLDQTGNFTREVAEGGRIGVEHRLHIYHNAYRVRLLEALQDAYEKTWSYLGDSVFESAALAFIEDNPPRSRNLRWYGDGFPQWLGARFPADRDIAELAMIDWQLRRAFDGPDASPMDAGTLATLTPSQWESVGFRFAPTLFIAPLQYNSVSIWHALDNDQDPPIAEALVKPTWLLIWRKAWQPHFRTIGNLEHATLSRLLVGASFADVCANLNAQFPEQEAAAIAAESLRTWLKDELIIGLG